MVRGRKDVVWAAYLTPVDLVMIGERVDHDGWYPMETFERLGIGILREIALGQVEGVRMWGRFQLDAVLKAHPNLLAAGDPRETLMRFQVLRRSFFDYDALDVAHL